MGFFGKLFGVGSPEKDISTLLSGPSIEIADEMERIYRNLIKIHSKEFDNVKLSARGVLKARLFGVTFMVIPLMGKWNDEKHINEMIKASSGIAMLPFSSGNYDLKIDKKDAISFSGSYMMDVLRSIMLEMKYGPSTPLSISEGFEKLVNLFVDALVESIGDAKFVSDVRERFFPQIGGCINANMKLMLEWKQAL